ncbi:MAG: glycosyltransferase [Mycobacteriaceae bacterium]|nr:glycosyltransferase [Mycobacteriaceae bacterium]MBV9641839.1 glycosyltransferase [Mycobacteriaceae bacterium]
MAGALVDCHDVSVVLLDRLIPRRLYPGADRVGHDLTALRYDPRVRVIAEVDWYWGPAITGLARLLRAERPDVIVLQWWTAATLHTYLLLSRLAARNGIPVVIEFHEIQDTGESGIPLVAPYCRRYLKRLVRRASGALVHTDFDVQQLKSVLGTDVLDALAVRVAPHGPYDHIGKLPRRSEASDDLAARDGGPVRVLFFGLIRPYKGAEDLIYALDGMTDAQAAQFDVHVVGETWEGWTLPAEAIRASRHRQRIRFENRYVSDPEVAEYFATADVLVLPYRRGSASGPLQIAMSHGIFVVMYAVGGLVEAVRDYRGAILVPPGDIDALRDAILSIVARRGQRFDDPHTWLPVRRAIESLMESG